MPVVASATFRVVGNDDGTVTRVLEEVNKCGCISADALATQINEPAGSLTDILRTLAGEGEISCNDDYSLCCADKEKLESFSARLARLRTGR